MWKKTFLVLALHAFITEEILKHHIKDYFKINGKQTINMLKKGEYVKFINSERKIKSPFMIYSNFESVLVIEDNGKQNPNKSYKNKCRKNVACSYSYKLVCADDKSSKPSKPTYVELLKLILILIIELSKHCSDLIKIYFNKEHVFTEKDNEDFENSTKCWICDNDNIDTDVKV